MVAGGRLPSQVVTQVIVEPVWRWPLKQRPAPTKGKLKGGPTRRKPSGRPVLAHRSASPTNGLQMTAADALCWLRCKRLEVPGGRGQSLVPRGGRYRTGPHGDFFLVAKTPIFPVRLYPQPFVAKTALGGA